VSRPDKRVAGAGECGSGKECTGNHRSPTVLRRPRSEGDKIMCKVPNSVHGRANQSPRSPVVEAGTGTVSHEDRRECSGQQEGNQGLQSYRNRSVALSRPNIREKQFGGKMTIGGNAVEELLNEYPASMEADRGPEGTGTRRHPSQNDSSKQECGEGPEKNWPWRQPLAKRNEGGKSA